MKKSPRLPLWQSVFWIVGSTFVVTGTSYKLLQTFVFQKHHRKIEPVQVISYIVQTGLQKEPLRSDYLAELIGLSADSPTLLDHFDEEKAREALLSCPVIQEAKVKKLPPNMAYIDYGVRRPIAWAFDFLNTAMDKEGYLFPIVPFFSPKRLPEIYLGKEGVAEVYEGSEPSFKKPLTGCYRDLALAILDLFKGREKDQLFVKRIDVSQAFFPTLGKRGIVVVLENELERGISSTHFLRLGTRRFAQEISNYLQLRSHLINEEREKLSQGEKLKDRVIDLRISQLAFID